VPQDALVLHSTGHRGLGVHCRVEPAADGIEDDRVFRSIGSWVVWNQETHMKDRVEAVHRWRQVQPVRQFADPSRDCERPHVFGKQLAAFLAVLAQIFGAEPDTVSHVELSGLVWTEALRRLSVLEGRRGLSSESVTVSRKLLAAGT
jgi:hypothetical protein